jgi:RND family efflux transporter MFP subunit
MPHGLIHRIHPRAVLFVAAAIAVLAIGYAMYSTAQRPSSNYATAAQGALVEKVDTTGVVVAADAIDLSFQVGGRIVDAGPAVGTHVSAGERLASISGADAAAVLEQARAALAVQQANFAGLQAGSRPEDLAVSQTAVSGAQATLAQSRESLRAVAADAYVKSDDAVHNKVDQFLINARSSNPTLVFAVSDSQTQANIQTNRISMEQLLGQWQQYVSALPTDASTLNADAVAAQTRANLRSVSTYLDTVATGLTQVVNTTTYTPSVVQGYQTSVQTARANITAEISALDAAQTAEKSAESALATAQSQLQLKQAGATPQQLAAQQAQVAVAQANVDAALAALGKTVIAAPIAGTITVNNAHLGQTAAPGSPLVSMISDLGFQFRTYVSQTDLAKLAVGDVATVTLDAYQGGDPFTAHVVAIDPAASIQGDVSSYKVTLQFDGNDARIHPGLTGSVKIVTKTEASALAVPTSAIITQGTDHFVLRKGTQGDERVAVAIGIRSEGGMTEILSGLAAGDQVRTFGAH